MSPYVSVQRRARREILERTSDLRGAAMQAVRSVAGRLGLFTEPPRPTGIECGSAWYDGAFRDIEEYHRPYPQSRYYFLWAVIVDRVRRSGLRRVLEIGCGPGQLAAFLLDQGVEQYT